MVNKFGDNTSDIVISNLQVIKKVEAKNGGPVKDYIDELSNSLALGYSPCYHFVYTSGSKIQEEIIPVYTGKKKTGGG